MIYLAIFFFAEWVMFSPNCKRGLQCLSLYVHYLTDLNDCAGVSCGEGTCVDGIGTHSCQCNDGFTGDSCETSKSVLATLLRMSH